MIDALINPLLEPLRRDLDRVNDRQRLIASNVANVDTPGYRARHLDFATALDDATTSLRRTDARHFELPEAVGQIQTDSGPRRADGNTVDLEREMADLRTNALLHATITQALRGRIQSLRNAIQEGRS